MPKCRPLLAALALLASATSVLAQQTIVGEWANRESECGTHWSYDVGPKHFHADEFLCSFDTVSREGADVRWTGTCDEGNGPEKETAVASDTAEGLVVRFLDGGGNIGPLFACDRR